MSEHRHGRHVARGSAPPTTRLRNAWLSLPYERRLAAGAALGLFVTLFLPWYQETVIPTAFGSAAGRALPSASLTGWAAFSFVEAAVLLVAAAVLVLLFIRAEGRAFHVPGGDGGVITGAGFWISLLIVWRMFDKEGTTGHGQYVTTSGIEWGIFIALGVAVLLAYAGTRIRLAHEPEPPLPGEARRPARRPGPVATAPAPENPAPRRAAQSSPATPPRQRRPRLPRAAPERGLDFSELDEIEFDDPPEPPTIRRASSADEPAPDAEDQLTTRLDRPE